VVFHQFSTQVIGDSDDVRGFEASEKCLRLSCVIFDSGYLRVEADLLMSEKVQVQETDSFV